MIALHFKYLEFEWSKLIIILQGEKAILSTATANTTRCVSWDFNLRDGIGDWTEDGCELESVNSEGITCHCNHLTNFAVLVVRIIRRI